MKLQKSKRQTYLLIITLSYVLTAALIFTGLYFIMKKNGRINSSYQNGTPPSSEHISKNNEINAAVWIATVSNINYPSRQGLSAPELALELDAIVDNVERLGADTIFFQVRPCADALYNSDLFPESEYVSGKRGIKADGGFDSLSYIISRAHKKGISVHAWINPSRVLSSSSAQKMGLCEGEAGHLHPEWTVEYADGNLYFDLGIPEVRALIADGIYEVVSRYDVDGVVFDDYFYPYPVKDEDGKTAAFDDSDTYKKYGGAYSLSEFRRENVRALIRSSYYATKKADSQALFGISPFGIWKNSYADGGAGTSGAESYYDIYCDTLSFAREGTVDYVAPQLYWEIGCKEADFLSLAIWWQDALSKTKCAYIPCIAPYRYSEGRYSEGELTRQLEYLGGLSNVSGIALYGYEALVKNKSAHEEIVSFLRK